MNAKIGGCVARDYSKQFVMCLVGMLGMRRLRCFAAGNSTGLGTLLGDNP